MDQDSTAAKTVAGRATSGQAVRLSRRGTSWKGHSFGRDRALRAGPLKRGKTTARLTRPCAGLHVVVCGHVWCCGVEAQGRSRSRGRRWRRRTVGVTRPGAFGMMQAGTSDPHCYRPNRQKDVREAARPPPGPPCSQPRPVRDDAHSPPCSCFDVTPASPDPFPISPHLLFVAGHRLSGYVIIQLQQWLVLSAVGGPSVLGSSTGTVPYLSSCKARSGSPRSEVRVEHHGVHLHPVSAKKRSASEPFMLASPMQFSETAPTWATLYRRGPTRRRTCSHTLSTTQDDCYSISTQTSWSRQAHSSEIAHYCSTYRQVSFLPAPPTCFVPCSLPIAWHRTQLRRRPCCVSSLAQFLSTGAFTDQLPFRLYGTQVVVSHPEEIGVSQHWRRSHKCRDQNHIHSPRQMSSPKRPIRPPIETCFPKVQPRTERHRYASTVILLIHAR